MGASDEENTVSETGRAGNTILSTFAMSFAWCMLWATHWACERVPIFQMPSLLGRVMMALELSAGACFVVLFLDKIDDMHAGSEDSRAGARAIQEIITALGILVGFSWEHC